MALSFDVPYDPQVNLVQALAIRVSARHRLMRAVKRIFVFQENLCIGFSHQGEGPL